jgi:uncharacterized protein YqeY
MSLKLRIGEDVKLAMKAKEQARLNVLRMLMAAIKQREVDERIELTDSDVIALVEKQIKLRKEAAVQFDAGGRPDSAQSERAEIEVLTTYLPQALSDSELAAILASAVAQTGAAGPQDMGKVMAAVKPQVAGRTDMAALSALIKKTLSGA